ncbi:metal tolerance protein C4-like [Chenopodium quinoa]|uniref:Cation efflux protein transmembrane domain-containing protein n=1 Tax=Chenopodium quinoa TaxID=63459 RepID=A0A803M9R7_CHEQI|nr:metal tolerance protein C4-like [Chenopodium quinoa]
MQRRRFFSLLPRPPLRPPPLTPPHSLSLIFCCCDDSNSSSTPAKSGVEQGFRRITNTNISTTFLQGFLLSNPSSKRVSPFSQIPIDFSHHHLSFHRNFFTRAKEVKRIEVTDQHSQRAVTTALWCNFLVFSLKFGVWMTTSSHVMLAEVIHSVADFANQALLAYGLSSSRRGPDALHPYGYSKERFVWSLISAVGIFCLGSGATIIHGFQHLWDSQPPEHIKYAALVIGGSFIIEGASLVVAIHAVRKGAAAEGMKLRDYIWRGHDPTSVAVMTEDGAAVTGLAIAGASLMAVNATGNPIYDPIGSIVVGNLLGMVAIFLIQRNRHALIGRAIDDQDMQKVLEFLKNDPVVDAIYDCKSEVIGPGFFRFKAEIDFNGVVLVQNYINRAGREPWARQFRDAANGEDDTELLKVMSNYGEEVVTALGSEVDRLESEIQKLVPGIRHVDIEAHNPIIPPSS